MICMGNNIDITEKIKYPICLLNHPKGEHFTYF
jgi:hypothetical protein